MFRWSKIQNLPLSTTSKNMVEAFYLFRKFKNNNIYLRFTNFINNSASRRLWVKIITGHQCHHFNRPLKSGARRPANQLEYTIVQITARHISNVKITLISKKNHFYGWKLSIRTCIRSVWLILRYLDAFYCLNTYLK